jgi:hypothetical protein
MQHNQAAHYVARLKLDCTAAKSNHRRSDLGTFSQRGPIAIYEYTPQSPKMRTP